MSWSSSNAAIVVYDIAGTARLLPATSTSTVVLSSGPNHDLLRMFVGIDPSFPFVTGSSASIYFTAFATVVSEDVSNGSLVPAKSPWSYINFLDSDSDGNFSIDESVAASVPQTWIASARDITAWVLTTTSGFATTIDGEALYTDPSVLRVPAAFGGGYLMLLQRRRHDLTVDHVTEADYPIESTGLFDIIAYWSNNLEFNDPAATAGPVSDPAVKGPLLLVDAIDALPDAPFRLFIGVPTAAFHLDPDTGEVSLYVYYTVDFPETPYLSDELAGHVEAIEDSPYLRWFRPRLGGQSPRGFIACKRFAWSALRAEFAAPTPEAEWTTAVSGELLGRVRVWVPQPLIGFRRSAEEILVAFHTPVRRTTDPEVELIPGESDQTLNPEDPFDPPGRRRSPATGEGSGPAPDLGAPIGPDRGDFESPLAPSFVDATFALYFRTVPSTDDATLTAGWRDGQGIWRATAMPSGVWLAVRDVDDLLRADRVTVFGLDFVVTPNGASSQSRDLVIPADVDPSSPFDPNTDPTDPDPVRVPQGLSARWWVFAGGIGFWSGSAGSFQQALGRVIGDEEDGQWPWEEAWRFA